MYAQLSFTNHYSHRYLYSFDVTLSRDLSIGFFLKLIIMACLSNPSLLSMVVRHNNAGNGKLSTANSGRIDSNH